MIRKNRRRWPESVLARSREPSFSDTASRRRAIISLTPLIDVVFILLVFFMLASSFLDWRSIPVVTARPPSTLPAESEPKPLLLSVAGSDLRLNGELLALDELRVRLQRHIAADPGVSVEVQPLGDTSLQSVIAVLDRLRQAGIERFSMVRDRTWAAPAAPVDD